MSEKSRPPVTEVVRRKAAEPAPRPVLPVMSASPVAVAQAFTQYREIQAALDKAMPETMVNVKGRMHRTKSYWRAIATAFNLNVICLDEKHVQGSGKSTDWGWLCTYRASVPAGRMADGDGSCFASEKGGRGQGTVHNVRSHAHTRAYNRAVANLVGFGEVSAEEMEMSQATAEPASPPVDLF
jgi:hypothetical protein